MKLVLREVTIIDVFKKWKCLRFHRLAQTLNFCVVSSSFLCTFQQFEHTGCYPSSVLTNTTESESAFIGFCYW